MLNSFIKRLRKFTSNPYLNVIIGIIFLSSGIFEMIRELKELEEFRFGAHHGVILFALLHILKTLPDIFEGLEYVEKIKEKK